MPGPVVILRELHRLRRHVRDLQDHLDQLPRQLQIQQARLQREEQALQELQDHLKRLKVAIHEKEVSLKALRQQIRKYEKQMEEATAKKEYDFFRQEIAAVQERIRSLEDEILDAMLQVEEETAQLPLREQAVQKARAELARLEAEQEERRQQLTHQLQQTLAELAQAEAALPDAPWRGEYQRLVRVRGEDALACVSGRSCGACYTEVTAQQLQNLLAGQFVLCKSCGRILYLGD